MMVTSKKGVSSALRRFTQKTGFGSYETALEHAARTRSGWHGAKASRNSWGSFEIDETFVGGKAKNRHKDKRGAIAAATGGSGKAVIAGAVRRKGKLIARVVENVRADTLTEFVRDAVSPKVDLVVTDKWVGYKHLNKEFPHVAIDHAAGEYVVGAVHTNTIEGFWSLIKRGMVGTFHKVSAKYLPLYVAESAVALQQAIERRHLWMKPFASDEEPSA